MNYYYCIFSYFIRSRSPSLPSQPYIPKPKNYVSGWDQPPTADGIAQQATIAQFYSSRAPESDQKAAGHSSKLGIIYK